MAELPTRTHRYDNGVADSARWDHITFRPGDIVVATPPKCGTTWTQMICALLVHGETLPMPLTRLSRWVDRLNEPIETIAAEYEAQPWRRILKTHTPLDGLPYDTRVQYVFCGRDLRDAFLSMIDHMKNFSEAAKAEGAARLGVAIEERFPTQADTAFPVWATRPAFPWMEDGYPFGSFAYVTDSYWRYRRLPNIHLMHYADLKRDLEGEMRRLAGFLDLTVDEAALPGLVRAASFERMREGAADTAPNAHTASWKKVEDFFKEGRLEAWRTGLSAANQALYEERYARRLSPDLKAWLEGGRQAFEP